MSRLRATQKDVAALAGVTRGVVSHVLHGSKGTSRVGEQTAERVRQAALQLGYRVNTLARNLTLGRTGQIGILHANGFPRMRLVQGGSLYFGSLIDGIIDGAFNHGYAVCLAPYLMSKTPEDAMADGRFDGFIWYSTFPSKTSEERLRNCSVPIVVAHARAADMDNRFPTVICDNAQGIRLGLEHLSGLGHKKIGYACDSDFLSSESRIRRDAFLSIGQEMGLDVSLIDVCGDLSGLRDYVAHPAPHTAIFAQNEGLGGTLMQEFQAVGLRIPEDISILGFDSTSYCDTLRPSLTAVSQPLDKIGACAVDLLVQVMNGETPDPFGVVLPCGLDVRDSTGPCRE